MLYSDFFQLKSFISHNGKLIEPLEILRNKESTKDYWKSRETPRNHNKTSKIRNSTEIKTSLSSLLQMVLSVFQLFVMTFC